MSNNKSSSLGATRTSRPYLEITGTIENAQGQAARQNIFHNTWHKQDNTYITLFVVGCVGIKHILIHQRVKKKVMSIRVIPLELARKLLYYFLFIIIIMVQLFYPVSSDFRML